MCRGQTFRAIFAVERRESVSLPLFLFGYPNKGPLRVSLRINLRGFVRYSNGRCFYRWQIETETMFVFWVINTPALDAVTIRKRCLKFRQKIFFCERINSAFASQHVPIVPLTARPTNLQSFLDQPFLEFGRTQ